MTTKSKVVSLASKRAPAHDKWLVKSIEGVRGLAEKGEIECIAIQYWHRNGHARKIHVVNETTPAAWCKLAGLMHKHVGEVEACFDEACRPRPMGDKG